jgi:hypothetical protein
MRKKFLSVVLDPSNEAAYHTALGAKGGFELYGNLVLLVAQALDEAVRGDNCWISLGATASKDALCFTLHTGEGKQTVFAPNLQGLNGVVADLL